MSKHTSDKLRIKRKHLVWLKDAKGLSQSSIDKAAASIAIYDRWLKGKDYRAFHSERPARSNAICKLCAMNERARHCRKLRSTECCAMS